MGSGGEFTKTIGIFGGSFDPVHNGHLAIARSFLQSNKISELWVLLTPDPPHKQHRAVSAYEARLEMLTAAFKGFQDVVVSSMENRLPKPSYTLRTLEYLQKEYPDCRFYLCIGEDSLASFKNWHKWKEILKNTELLVARRPAENGLEEVDARILSKTHFVSHQPVDISATEIRERLRRGNNISGLVPQNVEQIIYDQKLYRRPDDGQG